MTEQNREYIITELSRRLGNLLGDINEQVATAESCTGGGIAEAITRTPGSSKWFQAGYVTYSNEQKTKQLQVDSELFETVGAVSQTVVEAMVRGAQKQASAFYAIAVSGIAGPQGGTQEKPVGTVWLAWAAGKDLYSTCFHFSGDRQDIRQQSVINALQGLLRILEKEN